MNDQYTPSTEEVRDWAASGFLRFQHYGFQDTADLDRWLIARDAKHDAATRTAALEKAAVIAERMTSPQYMGAYAGHVNAARAIRAAKVAES